MPGIRHKPVGSELSQAEWEADDSHIFESAPRVRSLFLPPQVWTATSGSPSFIVGGPVPDRNPLWVFPDNSTSYLTTWTIVPSDWYSGALSAVLSWSNDSFTATGNVLWEVRVTTFVTGMGWGQPPDATGWFTLPSPAGYIRQDLLSSILPSPVAGRLMRIAIGRLGEAAQDTMPGAAWFIGLELRYTAVV